MKTVYLAGGINGHVGWDYPTRWRQTAKEKLEAAGYHVLDPLRGSVVNGNSTVIADILAIVDRDLLDIAQCDVLLVEMDWPEAPYIGTAMEIRYAWERNKEIVMWGEANRSSAWLWYHKSKWFDTLMIALEYLISRKAVE